ncbi:MAG: lysophospholipid acyltransferase family protein [Ignavibacteriales bacterium]|nr:MAG: lysophospholipid acyltransferase family protein [Ignavibacteriales bacterium]
MKNILEYILFILLANFYSLIGLKTARRFAPMISRFFFFIIPIRRKTVIENLTNAFPEYSSDKIKTIAYESYKSFSLALVELFCVKKMSRQELENAVNCPGRNLINEKYDDGKGLILLSAHFGNWEYVALSVSAQVKKTFNVVVKSQRNPYVNNWMNDIRTKWENKIIPLGASIRQVYSALKDKKIVAMVADQRGPVDGIRVNFFGRKVSVYPGPAILAIKTGAPIIYGLTVRQKDQNYFTELVEIDTQNLSGTEDEKVTELCQRHMSYLESMIRKYPEQWLWMHKLWKY